MAGLFFLRHVKAWVAVGVLGLLTGCTTLPSPPVTTGPSAAAASAAMPDGQLPEPVSPVAASPQPSRFSDFISRRLLRRAEKPEPEPVAEVVAAPEPAVDDKYQLTGEEARELERGHASWYGGQFHGRRTANGETYDKYALTAAHKTLPFGTIVRVRSLKLGREVDVRINDRGPFAPGRVIDVSQAAAEVLGLVSAGVVEVSLNVANTLEEALPPAKSTRKTRKSSRRNVSKTPSVRRR